MSEDDKILFQTVARVVLSDRLGTLAEQIESIASATLSRLPLIPSRKAEKEPDAASPPARMDLLYFNGSGGFTHDGREYVISTTRGSTPPAPWVNVLANRHFGTVVSESGSAYTWSENAHEFRLTPWTNDPVTDASGEALYLRDEETGQFWSPTPLPAKGKSPYVSRHGFGYSVFEHTEQGIRSELTVFVPLDQSVKFSVLKIKNISGRKRKLSATAYYELVMGTLREKYHTHLVTEVDPQSGALWVHNPYNKEFPHRVVFLECSESARFLSGDRHEFIGRNGTLAVPAAMSTDRLSGKVGAGLDPCAAMQVKIELEDGDEKELVFSFGAAQNPHEARALLNRFKGTASVQQALAQVWAYWAQTLGAIQVKTPDPSLDVLVNGWLPYQIIACRLWGRSGYYQSGGAYGFRDQLQDVLALGHTHPEMIREKLLEFASRQYLEGDVQHWWHPPAGRGVRSHCSDDYLWLVLATCRYVEESGDRGVLAEPVCFLEGPLVKPEEESYYDLPNISDQSATLYDHCVRAVTRSLTFGAHGLPLIGSGDWNDGMNRIGAEGKGESVWMAFFLCQVLQSMAPLADQHGDNKFAELCRSSAITLVKNIEEQAWDGAWYQRAYFDNGEVLGSMINGECQIDSIVQSWAVISGAARPDRAKIAMDQVNQRLVDRQHSLIKLFAPPFDHGSCNPGYIKGYVPGVRENGGQYTHAAVWAVLAFAKLKDPARAWELLNLINPIHHSATPEQCAIYKVEPYVMAGDVYAASGHAGRGGWTWYTGSASWMFQLIVEHLLGIKRRADQLHFEPCVPATWEIWKVDYRYRATGYHLHFTQSGASALLPSIVLDGIIQPEKFLLLVDDGKSHEVLVGL
jgi:cellobiose phosphorylase